jgi:hypothetical protein
MLTTAKFNGSVPTVPEGKIALAKIYPQPNRRIVIERVGQKPKRFENVLINLLGPSLYERAGVLAYPAFASTLDLHPNFGTEQQGRPFPGCLRATRGRGGGRALKKRCQKQCAKRDRCARSGQRTTRMLVCHVRRCET